MKLARSLTLVGLGLSVASFAIAEGCSSKDSTTATGPIPGQPPAKPSGATPTTVSTPMNFAIHKLLLGDADRSGVPGNTAWKKYGYNVDGKVTTATSTDVCQLAAGAPKSTQVDGDNGIDNSFGSNILPIVLTTAGQDAATKINDAINKGSFTIMLDIKGLAADAAQTNVGLSGQLFAGGKFDPGGATPQWSTQDNWPVRPELLVDPTDITKGSKITFPDAYIVNGTFVNGAPSDVNISLGLQGVALDIAIHQAVITFDHKGAQAANGTIAGVIATEELITALQKVAGRISASLCQGSAFDSIAQQIRQASDILKDGTNAAGVPCSGISIGLGFSADQIAEPSKVADLGCQSPDPCNPGTGGTCDAGTPPPPDSGTDTGSTADAAGE